MSLVLNGGVGGSGSTQLAYIDSRIVSALPATVSFWFKNGVDVNATASFAQWVDASETTGTYRMGSGCARSTGPIFTRNYVSRTVSSSGGTPVTLDDYATAVNSITAGSTTVVSVDDSSRFSAGEYVRLTGTFTGLTGITSGREWRIQSIAGTALTLALASSGTWGEEQSATVKWSAWQPEKWNLGVITFGGSENLMMRGGFVGNSAVTIRATSPGTLGQRPADIFSVLDRMCFGGYVQGTGATAHLRGELAHIAVWGVEPTVSECAELLTKAPTLVGWGAPLAYWPLLADKNDTIGSNDLELVGSPDITSDGPSIQLTSGGGGGSGYLPTIMRAQPINLFGF
jgi:hypothetical protein